MRKSVKRRTLRKKKDSRKKRKGGGIHFAKQLEGNRNKGDPFERIGIKSKAI